MPNRFGQGCLSLLEPMEQTPFPLYPLLPPLFRPFPGGPPPKSSKVVWGSAISSASGVRGRAPATQRFGAFKYPQTVSPVVVLIKYNNVITA